MNLNLLVFLEFLLLLVPFSSQAASLNGKCTGGKQLLVGAVGDIIAHSHINQQALSQSKGYKSLLSEVSSNLAKLDILYGNLEGPVAPSFSLTNVQKIFNFPTRVLSDLRSAGFDVLSAANNHALDQHVNGVRETLGVFKRSGLATATLFVQKSLAPRGAARLCSMRSQGLRSTSRVNLSVAGSPAQVFKANKARTKKLYLVMKTPK